MQTKIKSNVGTVQAGLCTEVNPADRRPETSSETSSASPSKEIFHTDHLPPATLDAVDNADTPSQHSPYAEGIELATLDTLDSEIEYGNQQYSELIGEADDNYNEASDSTPLLSVNQADPQKLLNNTNFSFDARCRLLWFLKKMRQSRWMRTTDEGFYANRIALGLCAPWFSGGHMALCGLHSRFCQLPDYCPRCCLRLRSKPAAREYRESFAKSPFWMMLTPSYECDPEQAGLHYVVRKADRVNKVRAKLEHFRPYADQGLPIKAPLTPDHDFGLSNPIQDCFQTIFDLGHYLITSRVALGVFAHREIAWNFNAHPVSTWITPNGTLIINSAFPITYEVACDVLKLFEALYQLKPYGDCLYSDLHCERITSQKELKRCLYYALKPMKYVQGYLRAIDAGADIQALNTEIGDRVYQGGSSILAQHRSPRRMGNLRCNSDGYIGAGSITADRKEQTELKRQGQHNQDQQRNNAGMTGLERQIASANFSRHEGIED